MGSHYLISVSVWKGEKVLEVDVMESHNLE